LSLKKTTVTDYSPLSKSKVEEFQVWNMRVYVGDVAAIGQTVSIRKLTFWDVEGASNSKSLSNLINLERITIQGYNNVRITKFEGMTSLAPLHKLPNLRRVTMSKGVYPEAELKGFGPNVKVVQN